MSKYIFFRSCHWFDSIFTVYCTIFWIETTTFLSPKAIINLLSLRFRAILLTKKICISAIYLKIIFFNARFNRIIIYNYIFSLFLLRSTRASVWGSSSSKNCAVILFCSAFNSLGKGFSHLSLYPQVISIFHTTQFPWVNRSYITFP